MTRREKGFVCLGYYKAFRIMEQMGAPVTPPAEVYAAYAGLGFSREEADDLIREFNSDMADWR